MLDERMMTKGYAKPLEGRVAFVTGAGSGIGRAGAIAFIVWREKEDSC